MVRLSGADWNPLRCTGAAGRGLSCRTRPRRKEGDLMSGYLTTHVLDTSRGLPAADLRIELFRHQAGARSKLAELTTNSDGRTDAPILPVGEFKQGDYELVFHAGDYLSACGVKPDFLNIIPIHFTMSADDHYHVPLLLSPYGYSTYRGS